MCQLRRFFIPVFCEKCCFLGLWETFSVLYEQTLMVWKYQETSHSFFLLVLWFLMALMVILCASLTPLQLQPGAKGDCTCPRPTVQHHLPCLRGWQRERRRHGDGSGSAAGAAVQTIGGERGRRWGGKLMKQFRRVDCVLTDKISLVCSDCFFSSAGDLQEWVICLQALRFLSFVKFKCSFFTKRWENVV